MAVPERSRCDRGEAMGFPEHWEIAKPMSTPETLGDAFAALGARPAESLPDYAPIPPSALGPALNDQGYYVGRVKRNLYWVTDGVYPSAFLTSADGVVLFDATPSLGGYQRRALEAIAAAHGVSTPVQYVVYLVY